MVSLFPEVERQGERGWEEGVAHWMRDAERSREARSGDRYIMYDIGREEA